METIQFSLDHLTWGNPIGEACKDALRLDFDHNRLKLELYNSVKASRGTVCEAKWERSNKLGFRNLCI